MATPEVPQELLDRLKTDAVSNGMGILYAGQRRLEHMVVGFRAEAAAEFGAVHAEMVVLQAEQARQGERLDRVEVSLGQVQATLAEVLRRLPEPEQG